MTIIKNRYNVARIKADHCIDHSFEKKSKKACIRVRCSTHVCTVVPPPGWIARCSRIRVWRWRHGPLHRELHRDSAQNRYRWYQWVSGSRNQPDSAARRLPGWPRRRRRPRRPPHRKRTPPRPRPRPAGTWAKTYSTCSRASRCWVGRRSPAPRRSRSRPWGTCWGARTRTAPGAGSRRRVVYGRAGAETAVANAACDAARSPATPPCWRAPADPSNRLPETSARKKKLVKD